MTEIEPTFVEEIPRDLESGMLYISIPYATAVHLCPCGCGSEVVTTLHPARFSLIFDGDTVSLHPSVGSSGLPCRSHYFITKNRIRWCMSLDDQQVATARRRDRSAVEHWERFGGRTVTDFRPANAQRLAWKARFRRFLSRAK